MDLGVEIMKKIIKLLVILLTLQILSACKSDFDKKYEMKQAAAKSPITELETPDGFRFDMDENELTTKLSSFPIYKNEDSTYKEIIVGNESYAVDFGSPIFYDGKLCSYEITIEGKISGDGLIPISNNDVKQICNHYKAILKEDYKFEAFSESGISSNYYVITKGNLYIEIVEYKYTDHLRIECENSPVVYEMKVEKWRKEATNINTGNDEIGNSPNVEVKNNLYDGGVKQVKDYLKYTLRDPDSYESIEWSEVKEKADGYYVRHKYRAKNGFGGYVVANQLFHLDFSGNVVEVIDLH